MPLRPRTSVLICTYNRVRELECALTSVSAQTDPDFEVIVVDDGSTDCTPRLIYDQQFQGRLRFLRNPTNLGTIASRNRALRACRGRYISILDADDFFHPKKLKIHGDFLDAHPQAGVVWGQARLQAPGSANQRYPQDDYVFEWDLISPYQVVHSATTWRREALIQVGGYDPTVFYSEGPDLFLKVGDYWGQTFISGVVVEKKIQRGTEIRRFFDSHLQVISAELVRRTIERRYRQRARALVTIPAKIQALRRAELESLALRS